METALSRSVPLPRPRAPTTMSRGRATKMTEPQTLLLIGDPYRCARALAAREARIAAIDPASERHPLHADEIDVASFDIELRSASLFALGRHFVVHSVDRLRATKPVAEVLERGLPNETFVTLIARQMKAASALRKAIARIGAVEDLPAPRGRAVASLAAEILAAEGVDLPPKARTALAHRCGNDPMTILQEARKLRAYGVTAGERATIVDRLVFPSAETGIYPFYDRLGERSLAAALSELRALREDPVRLLAGATRHVARLAAIRLLIDRRTPAPEIASGVGIPDWLARRLTGQARTGTLEEWAAALRLGVDLDRQVKSGSIAGSDALLRFVYSVTRSATAPARG